MRLFWLIWSKYFDLSNCQWHKYNKCLTPEEQRKWVFLYWPFNSSNSRWPSSAYRVSGTPLRVFHAQNYLTFSEASQTRKPTEELGYFMNPHQMVLTCVCNSSYFHPRKRSRPTSGLIRHQATARQMLLRSPHSPCTVNTRVKCLLSLSVPRLLMLLSSVMVDTKGFKLAPQIWLP